MRRGLRGIRGITAVAVIVLAAPASAQAACGGMLADLGLQPECPPPKPAPLAPDPGGAESPDQPVPPDGKEFGFSSALFFAARSTVEQELDAADRVGVTVHRAAVTWRQLQPTPGTPLPAPTGEVHPDSAIGRIDRFYEGALARDITPIFTATSAPVWATRYRQCSLLDLRCQQMARSDHVLVPDWPFLGHYREFVEAVKARWPRALIEPWNEPDLYWNHPDYTGSRAFAASPELFKEIQCAAHAGSKAVNDDPVLAAGWALTHGGEYLRRVYLAGGAGCWDIANVHAYPAGQDHFGEGSALAQALDRFRKLRAEHGDSDPVWVTETGLTTTGFFKVDVETQADASRRLYNRFVTMPDVEAVLFHTLRDSSAKYHDDHTQPEYGYGFLWSGWGPKPVYCEFTERAGNPAC